MVRDDSNDPLHIWNPRVKNKIKDSTAALLHEHHAHHPDLVLFFHQRKNSRCGTSVHVMLLNRNQNKRSAKVSTLSCDFKRCENWIITRIRSITRTMKTSIRGVSSSLDPLIWYSVIFFSLPMMRDDQSWRASFGWFFGRVKDQLERRWFL